MIMCVTCRESFNKNDKKTCVTIKECDGTRGGGMTELLWRETRCLEYTHKKKYHGTPPMYHGTLPMYHVAFSYGYAQCFVLFDMCTKPGDGENYECSRQ